MQAHYISSHMAQDGSPQFLDVPWVDINIETRASVILFTSAAIIYCLAAGYVNVNFFTFKWVLIN